MKANELRIGNYFFRENEYKELIIDEIYSINRKGVNLWAMDDDICVNQEYNEITPIPLTEEWLLKFGKKAEKNDDYGGFIIYYPNGNGMRIKNNEWSSQHISVKLEYVHQLQNLYFALTNEKLTIKNR